MPTLPPPFMCCSSPHPPLLLLWLDPIAINQVCVLGPLRVLQSLVMSGLLREGSKVGMITSEGGSVSLRTELEGGDNYG